MDKYEVRLNTDVVNSPDAVEVCGKPTVDGAGNLWFEDGTEACVAMFAGGSWLSIARINKE